MKNRELRIKKSNLNRIVLFSEKKKFIPSNHEELFNFQYNQLYAYKINILVEKYLLQVLRSK